MSLNKNVTIGSSQSVLDLALQYYGSVSDVFTMIDENLDIENLTTDPNGKTLNYTINNKYVQKYFITKGITVATKPIEYYNKTEGSLLTESGFELLLEDGYRLLV